MGVDTEEEKEGGRERERYFVSVRGIERGQE
jgi:hypothetical protein